MQPSPFVLSEPIPEPETTEDALMSLMMALGRQMKQRHPGDTIDYSALPLLKLLTHQGPMRLSAIAQVLGLDASTVSRHARQLEDGGLLERTGDPDDRRASRLAVSKHGNACLAQGFETRRRVIAGALADWTDEERETLRVLLHRLVQTLLSGPDPSEQQPDGSVDASAVSMPDQQPAR